MSDAAFNAAVQIVLAHEGGFTDDPQDAGSWTGGEIGQGELRGSKFGISAASYPALNIAALTQTQAIMIYERDWWDKYGYGRLPDAIGAKVFDLAVNMGPGPAHTLLQRACTDCGEPVVADGRLGPMTVAAAGRSAQGELLAALREQAAVHYRAIVAADPRKEAYLVGWLARAAA